MMNEFLAKLAKFVSEDPRLMEKLMEVDREFPLLDVNDEERKLAILDWFIFDYELKPFKKTLLEHFININKDMPSEEKVIYEGFKNNIYSLFEIKALKIGKEMIVKDLATEKEYWVREKTATQSLEKGQCVFTRLLPYNDHYIFCGSCQVFLKEATYTLRFGYKRMRENKADMKITPKEIAETHHGFKEEENLKEMDLDTIEQKLSEKLKEVGLADVTISSIIEKVNKSIGVNQVFKEITKKAVFPEEKDINKLLELLTIFWNKVPHKALGGMSPEEKGRDFPRGPIELSLIQELMSHLHDEVNPDDYPNKKELKRVLAKSQKKWLDKPNSELDGKTPGQIILEERKKIGNPRKEIGLTVTVSPIERITKKEKEAEEIFKKAINLTREKRYIEAVESYKQLVEISPDNYVAWGNMGSLYGLLLKKEESYKCLHKALFINPNYKIAKNNLTLLEKASHSFLKKLAENDLMKFCKSKLLKKQ